MLQMCTLVELHETSHSSTIKKHLGFRHLLGCCCLELLLSLDMLLQQPPIATAQHLSTSPILGSKFHYIIQQLLHVITPSLSSMCHQDFCSLKSLVLSFNISKICSGLNAQANTHNLSSCEVIALNRQANKQMLKTDWSNACSFLLYTCFFLFLRHPSPTLIINNPPGVLPLKKKKSGFSFALLVILVKSNQK